MSFSEPAGTAVRLPPAPTRPVTGVAIYGCAGDEAALFRELAPRFGVRPTLIEEPVSEANAALAAGNRCVSVDHRTRVTSATLKALSAAGVEYLSTRSIGYDHIDVRAAAGLGIAVGNVAYAPDGVADYTLMLTLMVLRHAKSSVLRVAARDFRLGDARGKELRDLTVGVVGTGRIGAAVVERLHGFGCRVLAHDKRPKARAEYLPLDELLSESDVVTLHTPLTADTRHLLSRERIGRMKRGAYVVNTGRGALIDTEALVEALESGGLAGAALDVVEGEESIFYADRRSEAVAGRPHEAIAGRRHEAIAGRRGDAADGTPLARLERLPNVLITPHTAYHTERALRDTVENSLLNCLTFESGK